MSLVSGIKGFFRGVWRLLKGLSQVITVLVPLLFLAFFLIGVSIGMRGATPEPLPERAALLINPVGVLVEDRSPREPLEAFFEADQAGEVPFIAVVRAIERAATDDRIRVLVLDLQQLAGLSSSQGLELAEAVKLFKATDKPVVAVGDFYDQSHYLLAAHADEILMHPEGGLLLEGFGVYRNYIRQLLENAYVSMHVFRVGENKSAVEPYLRDDMSPQEREVVGRWLGGLWETWTATVEQARGLESGAINAFIDSFPEQLAAAEGELAQLMVDAGLVDRLGDADARNAYLAELVGATDDDGYVIATDFLTYVNQTDSLREQPGEPVIVVVPIEGTLIPGESNSGYAGCGTVVEQLQRAGEVDDLAAVVLRINSPGGSVFASEVIRAELQRLRDREVPIVVSMAGVAASGGYYIAAEADEIWAQPTTLTGSIGVFAAFPTVERLYDYAGVTVDGVGTTRLAGSFRIDRPLDDTVGDIVTSFIGKVYRDFTTLVADGRDLPLERVLDIAGGKVWSGSDAREIGLVDELGGLNEAVEAAARIAGVERYDMRRIGTPLSPEQLFAEELGRRFGSSRVTLSGLGAVETLVARLAVPLAGIDSLRDPRHLYVRCFECSDPL